MTYFWQKHYGMPILCVDPMPELGPYFNQRAMFKDGFPRPVRWWPLNWVVVPIAAFVAFGIHAAGAIRSASKGPRP